MNIFITFFCFIFVEGFSDYDFSAFDEAYAFDDAYYVTDFIDDASLGCPRYLSKKKIFLTKYLKKTVRTPYLARAQFVAEERYFFTTTTTTSTTTTTTTTTTAASVRKCWKCDAMSYTSCAANGKYQG